MVSRGKKGIVAAFVAWALIILVGVLAYRFVIEPMLRDRKERAAQDELVAETSTAGGASSVHRIVLYADGFSGYAILRSSEFKKRLEKESIDLEIVDDGADYSVRMDALASGKAQLAAFPLNSFLKAGAESGRFPATIVLVLDETQGADAILAYKQTFGTIQDLNRPDARIVFTPESPSEFLAEITVESFVLPDLSENWRVERSGSEQIFRDLLRADPAAPIAYVLWEPEVSKALENPDVHVLLDSSKTKGYILDALVVERNFLKENEAVVSSFVESYLRTLYNQSVTGGMEELIRRDLPLEGASLSDEHIASIAEGIVWKNTTDNFNYFGLGNGSGESLGEILAKIVGVMTETSLLASDPLDGKYHSIYYDKILSKLDADRFHPGRRVGIIEGSIGQTTLEKATGLIDLPNLTEEQWKNLQPVGNFQVEQIRFPRMSAKITLQNGRKLSAISNRLKDWPSYYVTLVGQSKQTGDAKLDEVALDLALRRAEAAANFLEDKGTDPDRLRVEARLSAAGDWSSLNLVFEAGQVPY